MAWKVVAVPGWKLHVCPEELVESVVADARQRFDRSDQSFEELRPFVREFHCEVGEVEACWWDPGGMVMMGPRTVEEVPIGPGLFRVASEDFALFVGCLESAPLRHFPDGAPYYKTHGWLHCQVFTPEQRADLLGKLSAIAPEAAVRAQAVEERWREASSRLRDAGVLTSKDPALRVERDPDGGVVGVAVVEPVSGKHSQYLN